MGFKDLWQKPSSASTPADPEQLIEQAQQLRRLGRLEDARQQLAEGCRQVPDHIDLNRLYWDLCVQLERPQDAEPQILRAIKAQLRAGRGEEAVFAWFELSERLDTPAIDLDSTCRLAEAMQTAGHDEAASALLENSHEEITPQTPLAVALKLARTAALCRAPNAGQLTELTLARPGVPENLRQQLEQALLRAQTEGLRPRSDAQQDDGPIEVAAVNHEHRRLKVAAAIPRAVDGERLTLEFPGGQRRGLALRQIQAVAAVRLDEGDGEAYVLIDLLLDSLWSDLEELRCVRLRTRDFDPTSLVPGAHDAHLALGTFLKNLLASSQAQPLPDADAAIGQPFHAFSSAAEYQRRVLEITG